MALVAVAAAATTALLWWPDGNRYTVVADTEAAPLWSGGESRTALHALVAGEAVTFGSASPINTTSGPVIIRSVEPVTVDANAQVLGLQVKLIGSDNVGTGRGWTQEGLSDPEGFEVPPGNAMQIVVGLSSTDGAQAGMHGFTVRYEAGGRRYESVLEHSYVVEP